jgi:KUP system potassium uptake protein
VLALLGITEIAAEPGVWRAVNPVHGLTFLADNGTTGFLALGSVFLVVTGGEALYADMGHFGRAPIAIGWLGLAFPGLLLNYFGQGALLLSTPEAIDNPFYRLAPSWSLYPMVVLATCATIIASQALISGAFSLTMQATQLGYAPRVRIKHTSGEARGQIYVPAVNWVLMLACIGLVVGFRSSSNLAAAYGVAVTMTMAVTTLVFYVVAREHFEWSRRAAVPLCAAFLVVDLAFLGGNLPKIPHGGWFPLVVAAVVFTVLTTWQTGRRLVGERLRLGQVPLVTYLKRIGEEAPMRAPGTAVYLYSVSGMTPPSLIANVRANHVLHERVIVASVVSDEVPRVDPDDRLRFRDLGEGVGRVDVHYGFMESPDLAADLGGIEGLDPQAAHYFLGKETIVATARPGMARWRERLFAVMTRNATSAADYFQLPPNQIVELGTRVEL